MSKDAAKLEALDQKFQEITASREEIIGSLNQLNNVIQRGVNAVSGGQGAGLAASLKSITSFFQSSVNMMASLSKQIQELTKLMASIKVQLDDVQRKFSG
ncbi:MAG: hypothetical protein ACTSU5_01500 [Promethearchaeota archaeon]